MFSFRNVILVLSAALLLTAAPVFADIIHLKDGGKIEGKVINESETEVQIATKYGVQSIPMENIKEVEKTPTIIEIYRQKLDALEENDAEARYQLGLWCKEQGLKAEAELQFREALNYAPDYRGAWVELGYVFYGGKWVHRDKLKDLIEQKGYVVYDGRLMTQEDYDAMKAEGEASEGTEEEASVDEEPVEEPVERAAEEDTSVPWAQAVDVSTSHYAVRTNVGKKDITRYKKLFEELHDEYVKIFRGYKPKDRNRYSVWLFRNQQDFMQETGRRSDVGGYYDTQAKRVLSFKGVYGSGTTDSVMAAQCCYQYLDSIMENMQSAPAWIVEGFAVYFESAKFTETGSVKMGTLPRDRLIQLKAAIAQGNFITLDQLIRRSRTRFGPVEQAHAWSLIYFMKKKSSKYGKILSDFFDKCVNPVAAGGTTNPQPGGRMGGGRGRQRTNLAADFEKAIGDTQTFQDDWKQFISGLKVPPAGEVKGETFTSNTMGFTVTKPAGWSFINEGSAAGFQTGAAKGNSRFEILVFANAGKQDSKTFGSQYKNNLSRTYTTVDLKEMAVNGKSAVELVYSDENLRGRSSGTSAVYKHKTVIVAAGEKIYVIDFKAFSSMYDADLPDFDKAVESFKIES